VAEGHGALLKMPSKSTTHHSAMSLGECYKISNYFSFQEKLKLVTVLGAGLLVGTALSVIIPEGVHTLYETRKRKLAAYLTSAKEPSLFY
jgi:hypothetical protein